MTRMVDIALKHTRVDSERRDAILSGKYTDRWGRSEVLIDTVPCLVPTYVHDKNNFLFIGIYLFLTNKGLRKLTR